MRQGFWTEHRRVVFYVSQTRETLANTPLSARKRKELERLLAFDRQTLAKLNAELRDDREAFKKQGLGV